MKKQKVKKITVKDISIEQRVLDVLDISDAEIIEEAKTKYAGFLKSINEHISSLKESDYELYVIGAGQNVEGLESSIGESLKLIAVSNALESLEEDSRFKLLVDSYTIERPKALTNVLTSRRPIPYDVRNLTEQSLSAIGFFQEYLYTVNASKSNKAELIKNAISMSLYLRSIDIVNELILLRDKKGEKSE